MAEQELFKICANIRARFLEVQRVAIVHRVGVCPVGEASVVIAVSSAHRRAALEAAQYAIDTLKETVPIWKKVRPLAFGSQNKTWEGRDDCSLGRCCYPTGVLRYRQRIKMERK